MRSFTTLILVSTLTLGGCSMFTVKTPEYHRNKCTRSSYSPHLDTAGAIVMAAGSVGSIVSYNQDRNDGLDVVSGNGSVLGAGVAAGVAAVIYGVSAYRGFSAIKRCAFPGE